MTLIEKIDALRKHNPHGIGESWYDYAIDDCQRIIRQHAAPGQDVVERVAQSLFSTQLPKPYKGEWKDMANKIKERWRYRAKAAIAAINMGDVGTAQPLMVGEAEKIDIASPDDSRAGTPEMKAVIRAAEVFINADIMVTPNMSRADAVKSGYDQLERTLRAYQATQPALQAATRIEDER